MNNPESWVTYASNDGEALKAVLLARSLRRVITRRLLTIFIAQNLSDETCDLLEDEFDRCIRISNTNHEINYNRLPFSSVAKINCWKLNKLCKVIFIDCNSLVLRNCDHLFLQDGIICATNDSEDKYGETAMLLIITPSTTEFKKLVANTNSILEVGDALTFKTVCGLHFESHLMNKCNLSLDSKDDYLEGNVTKINILNFFGDEHPLDIILKMDQKNLNFSDGSFQKEILEVCMELLASESVTTINGSIPISVRANLSQNRRINLKELDSLRESIAIVGMGLRLPQANTLEEFWDLLINGKDGISPVPKGRWDSDQCFDRHEDTYKTQAGFLKCPIDGIDGKLFGLSPMELEYMDPQQRITLQVIWEALEHSGINPAGLKNTNSGVFGGWWRHDYKEMLYETGLAENEFFRTYMGNALGTLTGRISHILDVTGPSISTESGCSTSIVAVDMACKSLLNEDCDLAMAFGVNLLIQPFSDKTLNSVIAPDGHCKTFDAKADGFGRAEGCVVLVLKRFPDAVRDGDRIHALIRGSAVVQEGPSRSMGTPTKNCEALAMKLALEMAGVEPKEVSFVETHGTGTPVGDPLEVAAVAQVYSKGRNPKEPLVIGSVKTNIGHTESCSGIAGIIKTVLSLQNEVIPPHRNFEKLNPDINLEVIPAVIPLSASQWKRNENIPRFAGVSSFGITGTDAHVILQEAPGVMKPFGQSLTSELPLKVMKFSAKSEDVLNDLMKSYKDFLGTTNEDFNDVCYTANVGRGDFQFRSVIFGNDREEMIQKLQKKLLETKPAPGEAPKTCFLFTGQGSQYPGMGKRLYDNSSVFKLHFDKCAAVLEKDFSISIKEAMWGDQKENLSRTIYSQTSIFAVEYSIFKLCESWGVKPDVVLGHSLGEFAAAVAGGILDVKDALKLVAVRSRLIDNLPQGKMLVLKRNVETVESLLTAAFKSDGNKDKWLDYAAINSPEQTVVAGDLENIQYFSQFCENNNIKTHALQSTHAFHSRHMDPILEEYRQVTKGIKYNTSGSDVTFISGMEGKIMEAGKVDADYWVRHTREPVRFTDASKVVLEDGSSLFLEVGPQPVLSALIMYNSDNESTKEPINCLPSIRKNEEEWTTLMTTFGKLYTFGVDVKWENFHEYFPGKKVSLPYYPFQNKSYWFNVQGDRQRAIHPLVGTLVPNPSQLKLFQCSLDLNHAAYLRDHVIGSSIIYPGAGFLEMCLVSGHASYQCLEGDYMHPAAPITIENFSIEAPLALQDVEKNYLQVVVSSEDSGETRTAVYSKLILDKETSKWIRHASGSFSPYAVQWSGEQRVKNDSLDSIKSRCTQQAATENTYTKFRESGLKFGPTFQTINSAWKGEQDIYFEVKVTSNPTSYICHPVIIDAMFQAIMMVADPDLDKLSVPISVNKFIWYSRIETELCYIHGCSPNDNEGDNEISAVLYDANGQKLAVMVGATFIETTVTSILSAVEAQRTSMPSMYEEVWRERMGPLDRRIPQMPEFSLLFSEEYRKSLLHQNLLEDANLERYNKTNKLCLFYMLKALYDLGWKPEIGDTFKLSDLLLELETDSEFNDLMQYMFMELSSEGLLGILNSESGNMEFEILKLPPTAKDVLSTVDRLYEELKPDENTELLCISSTGKHLKDILTKKQSALSILFPEDPNEKASAESFYRESEMTKSTTIVAKNVLANMLDSFTKNQEDKTVIRICEVGAGTGAFSEVFVKMLEENAPSYEYTYTDISPVFFANGEKIFENSKVKVHYKTLNIEEDPTTQGFIPQHYDIVIASYVIHATKDLKSAVSNLRNLLRPHGVLLITELTKPLRAVNLIFGLLNGFWRFKDKQIRPYNCEMNTDKWETIFKDSNFEKVSSYKCYNDHSSVINAQADNSTTYIKQHLPEKSQKTWLVFSQDESDCHFTRKLNQMNRNVVFVTKGTKNLKLKEKHYEIRHDEPSDLTSLINELFPESKKNLEGVIYLWGVQQRKDKEEYESVCLPFLSLCKILVTLDHAKLFVFTRGVISIGDHEMPVPYPSILWGMTKSVQNENPGLSCRCIDLEPRGTIEQAVDEGFSELFIEDSEPHVAYRAKQRNLCRFISYRFPTNKLSFPKSERFRLVLPSSKAIPDLKFGAAEKSSSLGTNEVQIRVKAYALNFRDMFAVLKPDAQFDNLNTVGIDYAGEVVAVGSEVTSRKVGDPVFGINLNGDALPSHLKMVEKKVIPIPDKMTFCEAATLPAVAATAYLCLIEVAKIKENETILIHTGSGGVGLCAIQIAQSRKCKIVATAGSARKRAYLKNLGIEHVFHSRNTDYEHEIRKALGGKGVDVVFNSLTSPGFKEASLNALKHGGRFIEMSKLNTWTNEEVKALRPDVFYEIVDLSAASEPKIIEYIDKVKQFIDDSSIKPIPYVRFDASDIREALNYMQKAKHIGKIVCVMPESIESDLKIPLFNDKSTYLITGGLGGIGMEVAKWMTQSGAKHVVLAGRSQPSEKLVQEIRKMNSNGANVITVQCDVGHFDECKELLETLRISYLNLPPLRGIMHAAGVLSDASYENQSWEKYKETFHPKVNGAWNLHKLTLDLPLEHFVMYSSGVALFGSMGQSNHAAGNFFLDALTHYRYSLGLPASTVNWGQWGQVGVAANLDVIGLKPITPFQGISALEEVMRSQRVQTCVVEANFTVVRKAFAISKKYLDELKDGQSEKIDVVQVNGEEFWKDYDAATDKDEQIEITTKFLQIVIRKILKMEESEPIDNGGNLQDMGMDSLMMIEMKNVLQSVIGNRAKITASSVKDCSTINQLATRVVELVSGVSEIEPPTREEFIALIREDSQLCPDIKLQPNAINYCKLSEMQTVLITGVTGNLGPYVLREISQRQHIQKIYCIVRPSSSKTKISPQERLINSLKEKGLASDIRLDIIECVVGNVWKHKFDLPANQYEKLAVEVEGVFHLAVKSVWQEVYRKSNNSDQDIRTINVIGTKRILEFISAAKKKHLFHASTTLAASTLGEDGRTSECWPQVNEFDELPNDAYAVSKLICDLLIAQAVKRGLPCKVFRFPLIAGDSKTGGNISAHNNQLLLRMMSYMFMGFMPAYNIPMVLVPVDVCAEISVRLFFHEKSAFDIYNISNPYANDELEFEGIAQEFGFNVQVLEPDEFLDKLEVMEDTEVLIFMKKTAEDSESRDRLIDKTPEPAAVFISGKNPDVFLSKKLERLIPEYPKCMEKSIDILIRDLKYCKNSGVFSKLGLKP